MNKDFIKTCFDKVKREKPLVHCISNYVSLNDCANVLLASSALPIMAENIEEVEEVVSISDALVLNMGMPNPEKIKAMIKAGKAANKKGIPIVFDPVGLGVSKFRKDSCNQILKEVNISVLRGNISEIKAISFGSKTSSGVEASDKDKINEDNLDNQIMIISELSKKLGSIVLVSGKIDIIANADEVVKIDNGHPMMSAVTGTGCQLSTLIGAYLGANPFNQFEAVISALSMYSVAGELAYTNLQENLGNMAYRNLIIDTIYQMEAKIIMEEARIEYFKRIS